MKMVLLDKLFQLFRAAVMKLAMNAEDKCSKCKGSLQQEGESKLYLIDAYIDDTHPETVAFYQKSQRLLDENAIPSGRRTCYMKVFRCKECGSRFVEVIDFLRVRDNEILKGGNEFTYEEMGEFYENS